MTHILVVEDDREICQLYSRVLIKNGYQVTGVDNGQAALDMVSASGPGYYDAILMDIQMPVMDGYEATRQIRALEDSDKAEIPIVAVTTNAFEEDREVTMEAGMNGHLAKPYDIKEIMKTLKELLK